MAPEGPVGPQGAASFSIVEASIDQLQSALSSGAITSVGLVSRYLQRISTYDCRGISLNAIPVLNPAVFAEAAASDDRRAAGLPVRPLEGIPYTVKDSYKVKGMTAASGSPAFRDLISNEDAFTVVKLREAGAVLIGKTNMPPMAAGGMQRGVYGRAESPYNLDYLPAAFASGSSNGSAVSTAASFAAFGMGEETVSSGRSPASNNGLTAYTPSRGFISIRGNWPLYLTCDVVVPHTRTMDDLYTLLDVIAVDDDVTTGDFWRDQKFILLRKSWQNKPKSFRDLHTGYSLRDLRIAVPEMYIGGQQPKSGLQVTTSPAIIDLWNRTRSDLESLGATVIPVADFPLVTSYENAQSSSPTEAPDLLRLPKDWNTTERSLMIALAWDDFLQANADPKFPNLSSVKDPSRIFPAVPTDDPQVYYSEPKNAIHWSKLANFVKGRDKLKTSIYDIPDLSVALSSLEEMRKRDLEDWMDHPDHNFDIVVFPANGDVGAADADVNHESAEYAWKNGVKYSNGNRALRHLGVPSISVPMGIIEGKGMPINLTFVGRAYDDVRLLGWAGNFEKQTKRRKQPGLTPSLDGDWIDTENTSRTEEDERPGLDVDIWRATSASGQEGKLLVQINGTVTTAREDQKPHLEVFVDARLAPDVEVDIADNPEIFSDGGRKAERFRWIFNYKTTANAPVARDGRTRTEATIARDQTMIVVLAKNRKGGGARASGWMALL